ncbi:hypothetical protein yfred0001_7540 [Yersinia frederiksenii ATCC 33641]|nr:hypothetical protein yfred0001_7540 [Yersinia frederiksenii ATCC 33641]
MKIQRMLFSLVFCSAMAMSIHSVAQAKELNSHPPLSICYACIYPIWA